MCGLKKIITNSRHINIYKNDNVLAVAANYQAYAYYQVILTIYLPNSS